LLNIHLLLLQTAAMKRQQRCIAFAYNKAAVVKKLE